MDWDSCGVVGFDLGPLLQNHTWTAKLKRVYNSSIIDPRIAKVKSACNSLIIGPRDLGW